MFFPDDYKKRLLDPKIDLYMKSSGAICITGPKWCGKTTSGEYHCQNGSSICIADDANNYANRRLATMGPALVLEGAKPRLIDEWQEVPQIWDAVRFEVDKSPEKGLFILTGSSVHDYIHSGAGRISPIKMSSMSLYETGDSLGQVSIQSLFDKPADEKFAPISTGTVLLTDIIRYCIRGGWPASINRTVEEAAILPKTYLENTINKDVNTLTSVKNKRNHNKIEKLLYILAENDSKIVPITQILTEINSQLEVTLSRNTLLDYFDVFDQLYLIEEQEAFLPRVNISRTILKTPKHRFTDPSLVVATLGLNSELLMQDIDTLERVFDNLAVHELRVYSETSLDARVYHYSDSYKLDIDAVVQLNDGRWGAFQNRVAVDKIDDAAKDLLKLKKAFEGTGKEPSVLGVISGLSNAAYQREDGVYVLPITSLKP